MAELFLSKYLEAKLGVYVTKERNIMFQEYCNIGGTKYMERLKGIYTQWDMRETHGLFHLPTKKSLRISGKVLYHSGGN